MGADIVVPRLAEGNGLAVGIGRPLVSGGFTHQNPSGRVPLPLTALREDRAFVKPGAQSDRIDGGAPFRVPHKTDRDRTWWVGGTLGGGPELHLMLPRDVGMEDCSQVNSSLLLTDDPVRDFLPPTESMNVSAGVSPANRAAESIDRRGVGAGGKGRRSRINLGLTSIQTDRQ